MTPEKPMTLEEHKQRQIEEKKLYRRIMSDEISVHYQNYVDMWDYEESLDGYGKRRKPTNIMPAKKKRKKNKKTHR